MTARLLFVSTGLNTGGAETVLYRLLSRLDRERYEPHVVSLTETGTVGQRLTSLGIPVSAIQMGSAGRSVLGWVRLVRHVRRLRPDLVQTWMYHADLFGGLAARMGGAGRLVWGLRQSDLDRNFVKRSTFWTVRLCALLSRRVPDKILCCSWATQRVHAELGYDSSKMLVIPNGFDTDHFRPSDRARMEVRKEHTLPIRAQFWMKFTE